MRTTNHPITEEKNATTAHAIKTPLELAAEQGNLALVLKYWPTSIWDWWSDPDPKKLITFAVSREYSKLLVCLITDKKN